MAEVQLATASEKQIWVNKFLLEYVRESGLKPYMGTSETSIIRLRSELQSSAGVAINIPLITRLKGRGVVGAEVLSGNEDDLGNFNDQVRVNWLRNGVRVPKSTQYRTEIDLLDAAKTQLRTWDAERLRDDVITEMSSIIIPGTADANGIAGTDSSVPYLSSTAAQRNAFLVANSDRILFGNAISNASSGVWATAAGNVSVATGKMTASTITFAKRIARTAGTTTGTTNIRPFKSDMTSGREYFVLFVSSRVFRDLNADTTIIQANTQARAREGDGMEKNPLFQDGDLMYNGVIIREIPELNAANGVILPGIGAAGIDVAQSFLCGQSAVSVAYGQDPRPTTAKDDDYGFRPGVGIEELRGQKKTSYQGQQYGVVTIISAATPDA
jgi:hypothetical protein